MLLSTGTDVISDEKFWVYLRKYASQIAWAYVQARASQWDTPRATARGRDHFSLMKHVIAAVVIKEILGNHYKDGIVPVL